MTLTVAYIVMGKINLYGRYGQCGQGIIEFIIKMKFCF